MKVYEKIFKSNPDLLPEIEEYILNTVSGNKIDEPILNNIELAVAEAAANSMLHGNKNDASKHVKIKININSTQLKISFTDEGDGFNPADVPDPTIPENILKGSGRGLHIMRSLVDEINYIFHDNGTELELIFTL